jgi:rhodanese-related sulfurtransferase
MINTLKNLFGLGPKVDYADLVKQGAIILDVVQENTNKDIKGSLNTPLNDLSQHITKLKKTPLLLLVVHQGCEVHQQKSILKSNGFIQVHNGGGWSSLQNKL